MIYIFKVSYLFWILIIIQLIYLILFFIINFNYLKNIFIIYNARIKIIMKKYLEKQN